MEAQRPSAATEAAADTLALARASLRDGILLMSLGLVILPLALSVLVYAKSLTTYNEEGLITLSALLGSGWMVLSLLGAWRVAQAYAAGQRTKIASLFLALGVLYGLALPLLTLCLFQYREGLQDRIILAGLCLLPVAWLVRKLRDRKRPWPTAQTEPLWLLLGNFTVGLSFLVVSYPIHTAHIHLANDLFESHFLTFTIYGMGYMGWIFGICKAWRLRTTANRAGEPGWIRTLTQASWIMSVVVFAESLILLGAPSFSAPGDFATALALPVALALAWLCWPSYDAHVSWKMRSARVMVALLVLVLLPLNAAFYGAVAWPYAQHPLLARPGWIIHLHDRVRAPVAQFWGDATSAEADFPKADLDELGLTPLVKLKSSARTWSDHRASVGWYKLDPVDAMRIALDVSEDSTAEKDQQHAAFMLAWHGTDEQVRSRLQGNYSESLQTSLFRFLRFFNRHGFSKDARALFERRLLEEHEWDKFGDTWFYIAFDSREIRESIDAEFQAPDTQMPKRVSSILFGISCYEESGTQICRSALRSPAVEVRIEALRTILEYPWFNPDLNALAECMKGEHPGATPEERRLAAELMAKVLDRPMVNALRPSGTPEGLDEMEEESIAELLKAMRARLDQTARKK